MALAACAAIALAGLSATPPASAGGFAVRDNSTSGLMTSFAGVTAFGYDPSFQIYNPATLADLPGRQVTVDLKGFFPSASMTATNATAPTFAGGGNLTGLGNSGEMTDPQFGPTAFGSWRFSDRFTAGVALYSPFAVIIGTNPIWAGEYQLLSTKMVAYDMQLGGAYQVNDWLALGGAINVQYFDADLRRLEFIGFTSAEGYVKGNDVGVGYDVGFTLTPNERTRIGVNYRSAINHSLSGTAGVVIGPPMPAVTDLTTPDSLTVGLSERLTKRLTFLADFGWTGWSKFKGFTIHLPGGPEVRPQYWRDTWHAALGVRYALNDSLTLATGVLFDQGVSTGDSNTLSPDGDRVQLGVGFEKRMSDKVRLGVALSHMMIAEAPINVTETQGGNAGSSLTGSFKSHVTTIGVNLTTSW